MTNVDRTEASSKTRALLLGMALFSIVIAAYLLTYRGIPMSGDEVYIYDSMESLARRGYLDRTYEFNRVGMNFVGENFAGDPWPGPLQEPLASILGVPLFWLAQSLSGVGTMHVVWLFNIFLTAVIVVSLYSIALMHGFSPGVAWTGSLMFGLGTIAWFYSRLLFREPTMMLLILWAYALASMIQPYWQKGRLPWRLVLLMVLCFLGALVAKAVSIVLLPSLIILLFPPIEFIRRRWRGILGLSVALVVLLVLVIVVMSQTSIGYRYSLDQLDQFKTINSDFVIESLLGYQIGLSRSIWLYSPVLLVGISGAWLLLKQRRWRLVMAPWIGVLALSLWYGISLRLDWSGGWGWGPRYMLPMVAVMTLWVFPTLAHIKANPSKAGIALVSLAGVAGISIQLLGMANPLSNYYTDLFRADKIYDYTNYVESEWHWMAGNWQIKWSPIYYHLDRVDVDYLDMAWRVAVSQGITIGLILATLGAGIGVGVFGLRARSVRRSVLLGYPVLSGTMIVCIVASGLYALRDDPRYVGELTDVRELIDLMDTSVSGEDIVFLDREQYLPVVMNYLKTPVLVAALPYSRSERYGGVEPVVTPDAPIQEQLGDRTVYALDWSAGSFERIWLLASSSPFETDKIRPIEHYLVQRYYPVSEISVSYRARAISFLPVYAPTDAPTATTDAVFEQRLALQGYDLPNGTEYAAGDVLPVSLVWEAMTPIDTNYNVGVYLVDSAGAVHAQRDGVPQGTFGQISVWEPEVEQRDNHGLLLPEHLPSGEYQLLVVVYDWQTAQRLNVSATTHDVLDNSVVLSIVVVR